MKLPEKSQLPLHCKPERFEIHPTKLQEFHKAFKDQKKYTPPTLMAVSLKGIFDLLNQFETDWRKLLHATQSFVYHEKFEIPLTATSETTLVDIKFRAQMHWLQFETKIKEAASEKLLITSKSLLMIRENL